MKKSLFIIMGLLLLISCTGTKDPKIEMRALEAAQETRLMWKSQEFLKSQPTFEDTLENLFLEQNY